MRRDGFTLVELLIVIVILGILVAMGFLGVRAYTAKAYNITVKHDLLSFVKAQEIYLAEKARYLGTQGDYLKGGSVTGTEPEN